MIRTKPILAAILLAFFISSVGSCASLSEHQKSEYAILESAVTFSAQKVIGEYGDNIPANFSAEDFMKLVKDKIPGDYYEALTKHPVEMKSKQTYYLLLIFDPGTRALTLFDYSCTPEVDGPVLLNPDKYDLNKLELYDKCKEN